MRDSRLRALLILLAALWRTDGRHFGIPQTTAASRLRPVGSQKTCPRMACRVARGNFTPTPSRNRT